LAWREPDGTKIFRELACQIGENADVSKHVTCRLALNAITSGLMRSDSLVPTWAGCAAWQPVNGLNRFSRK
jgi:hypothetical protein